MIADVLGGVICMACLACYVPWLRNKWRTRTWPRLQRPGYGWPIVATGLHGARAAEERAAWLRAECRPLRERVDELHDRFERNHESLERIEAALEAQIRNAQGSDFGGYAYAANARQTWLQAQQADLAARPSRMPTYWEAYTHLELSRRRRFDPVIEPLPETITWNGPGGPITWKRP